MHSSGFIEEADGTIMVQLFPRADIHVEIALGAAQHLVRLLERYNWAMMSEPRLYYSRWRRFWRGMTRVERVIVVMYVESINGVMFRGRTVTLYDLPQALRSGGARRRRPRAADSVLREFDNLEQILTYAGADVEQIKLRRRITHHDEMALFGPELTDAAPLTSGGGVNLDAALEEQWQFQEREQAILECVRDEEDDPDTADCAGSLPVKSTSREQLGLGRLGQDKYRDDMLALWNNACAVTGCSLAAVLVASHAKRWADSTDCERLDPNNGLLLVGTLDKLFDAGLIGFDPNTGAMHVASVVGAHDRALLGLPASLRRKPNRKQAAFLRYHLDNRFHRTQEDGKGPHDFG